MRGKRLIYSIRLLLIRSSNKRADFLRSHNVFAQIGTNCTIQRRKIPLYPNLISLGNNVHLAAGVSFLTHDITHIMLNQCGGGEAFEEKVGCIEIGNNVFIGAGTRILYDVRIGSNVIIGTGSIITKDIPDNSVVAGVPAGVIGSFDDYIKKRRSMKLYPSGIAPRKQAVSKELAEWCWSDFAERREVEKE